MNIRQLTEKMNDLVHSKNWDSNNSKRPQTSRNIACSLVIEASEVLEHFQWSDECVDTDELGKELADVMLYLLQLANINNIDLEEATLKKLAINHSRTWDK